MPELLDRLLKLERELNATLGYLEALTRVVSNLLDPTPPIKELVNAAYEDVTSVRASDNIAVGKIFLTRYRRISKPTTWEVKNDESPKTQA